MIKSSVILLPLKLIESTMKGYKSELKRESVDCGKIREEKTITIYAKTIFTLVLIFNTKRYCFLIQFFDLINKIDLNIN